MGQNPGFSDEDFTCRGWELPSGERMTTEEVARFEVKRELRRMQTSGTGTTPSDQELLAEVRQDIQNRVDPEQKQMERNADAVIDAVIGT